MVEIGVNRNAVAGGSGNVDLHYGNADDLPYEDATFDAAFSINAMQVWPDPISGLEDCDGY